MKKLYILQVQFHSCRLENFWAPSFIIMGSHKNKVKNILQIESMKCSKRCRNTPDLGILEYSDKDLGILQFTNTKFHK